MDDINNRVRDALNLPPDWAALEKRLREIEVVIGLRSAPSNAPYVYQGRTDDDQHRT